MPSPAPLLNIVLHQPEIPGNTGAVGRTCVALGAKLWLVRPLGFRIDEKTLRRAGLDYWRHLDWEVADHWEDLVNRLPSSRLWYFSRFGRRSYLEAGFQHGDCLVFGSETRGLPKKLLEPAPELVCEFPRQNKSAVSTWQRPSGLPVLRPFGKSDREPRCKSVFGGPSTH